MITQTIAKQIVEISVAGMDKAEQLVKGGMARVKQYATAAASQIGSITTAVSGISKYAAILSGGFLGMFGRQAMQNTVESEQLGRAWEYLGRVLGDQLAPYVRVLTDLIVQGANAFRSMTPETKQTIMQVILLTAAVTTAVALFPVLAGVIGAVGAALAAIASPVGLVIAGLAAIMVAAGKYFNWFRDESTTTSNNVDEANQHWVVNLIGYLEMGIVAGAKFFNWYAKQSAAMSDQIADIMSQLGEAIGILDKGTTGQLRQMEPIKPIQIDVDQIKQKFSQIKRFAKATVIDIENLFNRLNMDQKGFTVRMNVQFESLQGTFDRLQAAFARGDGENIARDQLAEQRKIAAIAANMAIGLAAFGVVGQ
jgi:hypothetical protein